MPAHLKPAIVFCLLGVTSSASLALQTGFSAPNRLSADSNATVTRLEEQSNGNNPELVQTRFPTGEIKIERWVIENKDGDFVNHGEYVEFDIAGNVVCSGHYFKGKRTGSWSKLITEKQIRNLVPNLAAGFLAPFESKAEFDNGALSKDWSCTDAKGNLVFLWNFKNGKRDGESIWLNSKGQTIQSVNFKDNLAHGPAITLDDNKASES